MKNTLAYLLLEYFRLLAKIQLFKIKPKVVGITGSAGKTSVMEACAAVLQDSFSVKVSKKANSQSGLSLNILGLQPKNFSWLDWLRLAILAPIQLLTNWRKYEIYIAEMGIDGPNKPANMEYLLSLLTPSVGVYTSQSTVHAQAFDGIVDRWLQLGEAKADESRSELARKAIGQEKVKLLLSLPASGTAIIAGDDPLLRELSETVTAKKIHVGQRPTADLVCRLVEWKQDATYFEVAQGEEKQTIEIRGYWLPRHYANSLGAAGAVGLAFGLDLATSCRRIERHFYLPPGRATLLPAIHQATILDSSYNSSTQSLLDFFEMLQSIRQQALASNTPFPKRIIGLLGDMREIGQASAAEHSRIATAATDVFDQVFLVGPQMKKHVLPILNQAHIPAYCFTDSQEAGVVLSKTLQPHDLLFAKGSQNTIFLEKALAVLLKQPETAQKVLARQEGYWRK